MKVIFSPKAVREFRRLPKTEQQRIKHKIATYTESSDPLVFAKAMTGEYSGNYRFRIGDYRVIFDCTSDMVYILKIGHRKDIYK